MAADELFSGFRKDDRLYPVITIVFYFGSVKKRDGATSLHDMLKLPNNKKLKSVLNKYVPNYHINLLDVSDINDVNIFKSDIQIILGMLKYRGNADELRRYANEHWSYFKNIDNETCCAVEALLNSNVAF